MRYLLRLSYRGTAYHGWQIQENAHSVQAELEERLTLLCGETIGLIGCGRTDTGVHAKQFVAHMDCNLIADTERLLYKLNQLLPEDIVVYEIAVMPDDFHARFSAISRTYEYHITRIKDPFRTQLAWHRYGALDIDAMNKAASILLRHEDFQCFSKVNTQVDHFLCQIHEARWTEDGSLLIFTIKANRFLRNMVRAIVGTLIEVGRKNLTIDDFGAILLSRNRSEAGQSVPAHGLFLTEIVYPEQFFLQS